MSLHVPKLAPNRIVGKRAYRVPTWCGPYAFAVIAGIEYPEAMATLKKITRRKRIMGTYKSEMARALDKALRVKSKWQHTPRAGKPTLKRAHDWLKPNRLYLIVAGNHYVTVETRTWTLCHAWQMGWFPLTDTNWRNRRVTDYLEIRRIPDNSRLLPVVTTQGKA